MGPRCAGCVRRETLGSRHPSTLVRPMQSLGRSGGRLFMKAEASLTAAGCGAILLLREAKPPTKRRPLPRQGPRRRPKRDAGEPAGRGASPASL